MKWFKHLSATHSDPDFMEAEMIFGTAGPYVFWRTLEILAKEDAVEEPLEINKKVFRRYFPGIKSGTLWKVLGYYSDKRRINIVHKAEEYITIFCPKLCDISSDYSSKVRRDSESTEVKYPPQKKKENKKKKEKENIPPIIPQGDWSSNFTQVFLFFMEYRKNKNNPMTQHAINLMIEKLKKLSNGDEQTSIDVLNQSIMNGWTGVFSLSKDFNKNNFGRQIPTQEIAEDTAKMMEDFK